MALTKPTPPVPPTIDKGEATEYTPKFDAHQFFKVPIPQEKPVAQDEKPVEIQIPTPPPQPVEKIQPTPEEMAREAVANGAGALTKRTVTRPDEETNSEVPKTPVNLPVQSLQNTNSERGRAILREFQNEDRQMYSNTADTPRNFNLSANESHGGFYWIVILVLAGIFSIVFVRKFLVKEKPALKKSDLFNDADKKLQAVTEKVSAPIKKSPPKNDDDKSKHFEVRV